MNKQAKQNNKKENYGAIALRLFKYVASNHKLQFFIILITSLINALGNMISAVFLMYLVDKVITPMIGVSNPDYSQLTEKLIYLGIFYIICIISLLILNLNVVKIAQNTLRSIREKMFSHMQTLPVKYFDQRTNGEVMSLYTNDTDALMNLVGWCIPQIFSSLLSMIIFIIVMIITDIPLTLFTLFVGFIMLVISKYIGKKSANAFINQQNYIGKINGYIEEMINGQKVIKVFSYEENVKKGFNKLNNELYKSNITANKYANIIIPIIFNIGNLHYVITAIIGGLLIINDIGSLTLGKIILFLQLARGFNLQFLNISQQSGFIGMALAGASRIFKLMDEDKENDKGHITLSNIIIDKKGNIKETKKNTGLYAWKEKNQDGTITYTQLKGNILFDKITFGYNQAKPVLYNITIHAKPKQKIAFVGATGAGKTTITNLLNRFYDIQKGVIKYDGVDIKQIKKYDLRKSMGIVLQDTQMFTGTIYDNIKYGNLDATPEQIYAAAKLANADKFIKKLPNGYDTIISGINNELSQGQRQLLSIARAALSNPSVLILDEATSSIDTRTESIVQSGIDKLMKGRTVFVIAHRLSTVRNADLIIVLDKGKIIEQGNHKELIKKKGKYYELYTGNLELE